MPYLFQGYEDKAKRGIQKMTETDEGVFLTPEDCGVLVRFQITLAIIVFSLGVIVGWWLF